MITYIQKMGNSLGVYIPKVFAEELNLEPKSAVEIKEENGMLQLPLSRAENIIWKSCCLKLPQKTCTVRSAQERQQVTRSGKWHLMNPIEVILLMVRF